MEDAVDDLLDRLVGYGLQGHQQLVAEQVGGQAGDPGGDPGGIEFTAFDAALDDPVASNVVFPIPSVAPQYSLMGYNPYNLTLAQQFPWFGTLRLRGEVADRDVKVALAELATAWARREPHGSTRGFVAYLSAVAEAGVEPTGGEEPPAPGAVVGLALDAVKGLGFDHVFALGLEAEAEWGRIGWPARAEMVLSRVAGADRIFSLAA